MMTEAQKLSLMIERSVDLINQIYIKHGYLAKPELNGLRNGLLHLINDKKLTHADKKELAKLPSLYNIDLNNLIQTFR